VVRGHRAIAGVIDAIGRRAKGVGRRTEGPNDRDMAIQQSLSAYLAPIGGVTGRAHAMGRRAGEDAAAGECGGKHGSMLTLRGFADERPDIAGLASLLPSDTSHPSAPLLP
jgi:hypothetical protein